ncbi:MAG: DUF401 family protein [Desulfosoma sp.]
MLDHVPALVRVLMVFVGMLIAIRKKVPLGHAFFFGSVTLGFLFAMGPLEVAVSVFRSFTHAKTLSLAAIVSLILVLSHSLEAVGQMERLLASFQGLVRAPRLNLVVFPSLIGLLPMPGGAIFSAPMVKTLGQAFRFTGDQLSYINYWFRHIWEYWWPLYPGVLLTTTMAGLDLWVFVSALFPMTVVAVAAGYLPLSFAENPLKNPRAAEPENHAKNRPPLQPFLRELTPIAMAIAGGLGLGFVLSVILPSTVSIAKELGLMLALAFSIFWVWRTGGLATSERLRILKRRQLWDMFYMVGAILVFKGILDDAQAVQAISSELLAMKIPLMPITMILPFLVGMVVGITIAFVGTTFPILISLVHSFGEGHAILGYMMLGLVSGFVGVLLSPLHLCLLLSNEYFGTSLTKVLRLVAGPSAVLVGCSTVYFFILRHIL